MNDFKIKINSICWLEAQGIEYYCSLNQNHLNFESINAPKLFQKTATQNNMNLKNFQELEMNDNPIKDDTTSQARTLADNANSISELKKIITKFEGCGLKKLATNTVFSDGNIQAPFMFIGEAPGATEDKMGIPFCGDSGKLLDNMLESIGVSRMHNAYITNTVFWRPPANRPPTQSEIDICRPFVEKHIALIKPKIIILVGSTAATSLLGKHAGISKIRQEYSLYSNKYTTNAIPITAIFHPAYLLRQPLQKKTTWYDLLRIKSYVEENNILSEKQ